MKTFRLLLAGMLISVSAVAADDAAAIRRLLDQRRATIESGDRAGWLAVWTEDTRFMDVAGNDVVGKEAIRAWADPYFDQFRMQYAESMEELVVSGKWAFARVSHDFRMTPKSGGSTIGQRGKGLITFRKEGGNWRIAHLLLAPAPADTASEAAAIRAIDDAWFAAEKRRDIDSIVPHIAEDAVFQPPDGPTIKGLDAVRGFYKMVYATPYVDIGGGSDKIVVASSGDQAYDIGHNYVVMRGPKGESRVTGKYLSTWQKFGADWKLTAISWNPDAAPNVDQTSAASEIRERSRALAGAEAAHDFDNALTFWAPEAVVHVEGLGLIRGLAQIRPVYDTFFKNVISFRGETADVAVSASGDVAWETGVNYMTSRSPKGPVKSTSKYLVVWTRGADGEWRVSAVSVTNNPK